MDKGFQKTESVEAEVMSQQDVREVDSSEQKCTVADIVESCFHVSLTVERDMKERERPLEQILHQYITYVKPAFEEFCLPVSM